jgi:acetyl esterase/lipase
VTTFLEIIGLVLGLFNLLLTVPLFIRAQWPSAALWIVKLYISALSPALTMAGALCTAIGWAAGSVWVWAIGALSTLIFLSHIVRITRARVVSNGLAMTGKQGENGTIPNRFLPKSAVLRLPGTATPRIEQNVTFSTVPGTNRQLLCDVWRPHESVRPSGVAFIYLHGSAWYLLDKDCGTRPFFSHLSAQGHVVMDVAYRLAPETDMMGMVNDVKRAIVWMKENAGTYGVDRNRVVLGGGSAGGHLALLTAYTATDARFAPAELAEHDVSTCAVVSLYGPADLRAMYYHTNQHLTTRSIPGRPRKEVSPQAPTWMKNKMGEEYHRLGFDKDLRNAGAIAPLMCGHPDESPENYVLFSPIYHVNAECPPTLLIHGQHDVMAPVDATLQLYDPLAAAKVPTIMHILPQTDHAFDLILPGLSPSAHTAFKDVQWFLARLVSTPRWPAYDADHKRSDRRTARASLKKLV